VAAPNGQWNRLHSDTREPMLRLPKSYLFYRRPFPMKKSAYNWNSIPIQCSNNSKEAYKIRLSTILRDTELPKTISKTFLLKYTQRQLTQKPKD
jgi:hypothetical protein